MRAADCGSQVQSARGAPSCVAKTAPASQGDLSGRRNGSGKSTLLEVIAVAWGFKPEGGTKNCSFSTRDSHSDLDAALRMSWPLEVGKRGISHRFLLRGAHFSRQRFPPWVEIDQSQHGEGAVGVLDQATITRLGKAPESLEDEKRGLHLGPHLGFAAVRALVGFARGAIPVARSLVKSFVRGASSRSRLRSSFPRWALSHRSGFRPQRGDSGLHGDHERGPQSRSRDG